MAACTYSAVAVGPLPTLDLPRALRNDIASPAMGSVVSDSKTNFLRIAKKETAIFGGLLLLGLVFLPVLIWLVGDAVFGDYAGGGFGDFFRTLSVKIRSWDPVAWFLVLAPWLGIQIVRLAAAGWRFVGKT